MSAHQPWGLLCKSEGCGHLVTDHRANAEQAREDNWPCRRCDCVFHSDADSPTEPISESAYRLLARANGWRTLP